MGCLEAKHEMNKDRPVTVKNIEYLCNDCFQKRFPESFEQAYHNLSNWAKIASNARK